MKRTTTKTRNGAISAIEKPNRCEFERYLNDLPFPANPPPSLKEPVKIPRSSKKFGSWLYQHNHPEFIRSFELWRATQ